MNDIATHKAQLRTQMLKKRQALSSSEKLEAAKSVKLHFADHPYLTYAKSFAGYYAMKGELDVLPIFNHMAKFNKQTALPRTANGEMTLHAWAPGTALEEGEHGIKSPSASAPVLVPEVVLVPLIAFDDRGYRLGYGGGYYDKFISAQRQQSGDKAPLFVGVGYDMQEVAELPTQAHDQPLDAILTNEGVSFFW